MCFLVKPKKHHTFSTKIVGVPKAFEGVSDIFIDIGGIGIAYLA